MLLSYCGEDLRVDCKSLEDLHFGRRVCFKSVCPKEFIEVHLHALCCRLSLLREGVVAYAFATSLEACQVPRHYSLLMFPRGNITFWWLNCKTQGTSADVQRLKPRNYDKDPQMTSVADSKLPHQFRQIDTNRHQVVSKNRMNCWDLWVLGMTT